MYSLILVDYNSIQCAVAYAGQCADRMQGLSHVVLVDNADHSSLDYLCGQLGSCEEQPFEGRLLYRFTNEKLTLIYCHSGENLGYARGNNLGAKIAEAVFDDPYYIISNNDIILPERIALEQVTKRFAEDPQIAVLGPGVVGNDGISQTPRKKQSAFKKLIAWYWGVGPMRKYVDDVIYNAPAGPCEWVMGCFFFVRRDAFAAAGGFDGNTFLYAEEMILSARLRELGYNAVYDPLFTVIHDHREQPRNSPKTRKTIRISFASNCYYYKTYCGTSAGLLLLAKCSFALYMLLFPLWQRLKRKG